MRLAADQTRGVVVALGTAQTIAWAATYYLPAILANAIARDIGVSPVMIFTAFTMAMIISALLGPWSGRFIDRHGGRDLLLASNLIVILGLVILSQTNGIVMLFAAWCVIGIGMGIGLYESAFATLAVIYGKSARQVITGITLIAGFASTIGWPITAYVESQFGWRVTCLVWAVLLFVVALPLNSILPEGENKEGQHEDSPHLESGGAEIAAANGTPSPAIPLLAMLSFVFATTWFCSTAMASHLPRLLEASGTSAAVAVAAGALIGPAQVLARLAEYRFMQSYHPVISASFASLCHPIGALVLLLFGGSAGYAFTAMHGAGAGLMTIAKGTLPLAMIGSRNYGYWQGVISVPGRILQAFAPLLFGFAIEAWGSNALWVTTGLGLSAFIVLMMIKYKVHPLAK